MSSCAQVWKTHRRVCGPGKANPFAWPLLSDDELHEVLEHMHETTGHFVALEPERNTVAKALQHDIALPLDNIGVRLHSSSPPLLSPCLSAPR